MYVFSWKYIKIVCGFLGFFVGAKHNFRQSGTADGTVQTTLWIQRTKLLPDETLVRIVYVTLFNWEEIFYNRKLTLLYKNISWLTLLKTWETLQFNLKVQSCKLKKHW